MYVDQVCLDTLYQIDLENPFVHSFMTENMERRIKRMQV